MSNRLTTRARRGLIKVRADAGGDALLNELQQAFATFKTEHEEQIKEIKSGYADVVKAEKVERINSAITEMQAALDEVNSRIAALRVGGTPEADPDKKAYAAGFEKFFRKGVDAGLQDLAVKAKLSSSSDPDGGYVVTEEMETAIDRVLEDVSVMRSLAQVRRISGESYSKLVTTSGATGGWVGEEDDRPETETPKLSKLTFAAMELYANPATTQTLLDDEAVSIADWLAGEVDMEFAELEGAAFWTGTGVKQLRGVLNYPTVANANWSWGKLGFEVSGAAADFAASDPSDAFLNLIFSLRRGYRSNATFVMNDLTTAKVRKFKDGQGNYIWQPSAQLGEPATLHGYAHESDDFLPDVGVNAFPVAFGDFRRGYLIVDRIGIRVLRDPYTNKPNVQFYTTKRIGGGVQNFQAIKLLKIST